MKKREKNYIFLNEKIIIFTNIMDIVLTFIFILLAGLIFNHFLKFPFEYYFFIISILFALKYIRIERVPESDKEFEKPLTSYRNGSNFPLDYYNPNKSTEETE